MLSLMTPRRGRWVGLEVEVVVWMWWCGGVVWCGFVAANPHTESRNAFTYDPATRQVGGWCCCGVVVWVGVVLVVLGAALFEEHSLLGLPAVSQQAPETDSLAVWCGRMLLHATGLTPPTPPHNSLPLHPPLTHPLSSCLPAGVSC
jgi:hypothetical protein